jgi:NOL1/NOP2/sun family putative RNA methylase
MKLKFPEEFKRRISKLTDFKEYEECANKFLRRAIRINTLKIPVNELKPRLKNWKLTQIPWSKEAFWIEGERRDIGHLMEHQLGYIYVQEAASLIPSLVLEPKGTVLDMAAAPGSKTTHMAQLMKNQGLIIANDKNYRRITSLSANLQRCGVTNTITTIMDARNLKGNYDKILLDAPCSASGTIRGVTKHSANTLKMWSLKLVNTISNLQKQLILKAYKMLNSKGTLVYSTCSLEPEEDEEVVEYLLDKTDAKLQKIPLKLKSSSKEYLKLWPQYYDTEGFFIAKITKPS